MFRHLKKFSANLFNNRILVPHYGNQEKNRCPQRSSLGFDGI